MAGPSPENVAAIAALRARGMSYRAIDRALGFSGSGRGIKAAAESKPAANLTAPLQALVRGEAPVLPARRQQAVRQPVVAVPGTNSATATARPAAVTIIRQLQTAARLGQQIQLVVTFTYVVKYGRPLEAPGEVELFSRGGWAADKVLQVVERAGSVSAGMRALALRKPGVEEVGRVTRVQLSRA